MAHYLLPRDIINDVQSAPETFSSWDKCMEKAYCKYVANHQIIPCRRLWLTWQKVACDHRNRGWFTHSPLRYLVFRSMPLLRCRTLRMLLSLLSFRRQTRPVQVQRRLFSNASHSVRRLPTSSSTHGICCKPQHSTVRYI